MQQMKSRRMISIREPLRNSAILVVLTGTLMFACKHSAPNAEVKLVSGRKPSSASQFPATVQINKCTASRVGESGFLLAAHCFYNSPDEPIYNMQPGGVSNIGTGIEAFRTFKLFKIRDIKIHPSYVDQMESSARRLSEIKQRFLQDPDNPDLQKEYWDINTVSPQSGVSDIAIVFFELDDAGHAFLESVKAAKISTRTLDPTRQRLLIGGYGCTEAHGRDIGILHYAPLLAGEYRLEDASFIKKKDAVQGCEGDSGGPVYLDESPPLVVVGVNSFVSDNEDRWTGFARLDALGPNNVSAFLRRISPNLSFAEEEPVLTDSETSNESGVGHGEGGTDSELSNVGGSTAPKAAIPIGDFHDVVSAMIDLGYSWVVIDHSTNKREIAIRKIVCSSNDCSIDGANLTGSAADKISHIIAEYGEQNREYKLNCIISFSGPKHCQLVPYGG
jgi:hypothetical protein